MAHESDEPASFRERLAAIPKADDQPIEDLWGSSAPPAIRPKAPVARPARPEAAPLEHDEFFDDGSIAERSFEDDPFFDEPDVEYDDGNVPTRRRRRIWPLVLFMFVALAALVIVVPLYVANRTFQEIDRVSVGSALTEPIPGGTNVLLVGTDSRAGIDAQTENSQVILGEGISGERTDTMMVLRVGEDGSSMLSLPRDLWLPINGGDSGRINSAFARGPDALVNTISNELGIPISHYVQVDLAGFIEVVDAVGGVDITIPNPAFDRGSGLDLPTAGVVTLDSTQALAYVRSRFYTEIIDGAEVEDLTSDLGRVQRQQVFLSAMMDKLAAERNPATLNAMTGAIGDALVIDDATSLSEVLGLLNQARTSTPESVSLPTTPTRVGNAAVLVLNENSQEVLDQFS